MKYNYSSLKQIKVTNIPENKNMLWICQKTEDRRPKTEVRSKKYFFRHF